MTEPNFSILELNTQFKVQDWLDTHMKVCGDVLIAGYTSGDGDDCINPFEEWDGEGEIVIMHDRYSSREERDKAFDALGLNRDGEPDIEGIVDELTVDLLDSVNLGAWDDLDEWVELMFEDMLDLHDDEYADEWIRETTRLVEGYIEKRAMEIWQAMLEAGQIGVKYAEVVSVYIHGGIAVRPGSRSQFPDAQWDTCHGVWIPDKTAIENIDYWPEEERKAKRAEYLSGVCDLYTAWANGDVHGVIVDVFNLVGDDPDDPDSWELDDEKSDACWGYFGSETVKKDLKTEFDSVVKDYTKAEV